MRRVINPKLTEQEQRFEDALIAMGVTYDVAYRGERKLDDWVHDEWIFTLRRHEGGFRQPAAVMRQEYRTGTGHRKPPPGPKPTPPYRRGTLAYEAWEKTFNVVQPSVAGVLYSLFMDASSATETFEDWCSDFGYSDDSIKAMETYRACQKVQNELRLLFTHEQREQLDQLLEGY